jgi:origin recognition complex subunit 3
MRADMLNRSAVPAGFIVTGPNIASQGFLFNQLSERLKEEINGPVVTLRSGDASNLKTTLKQLIRDATNQRCTDDEENEGVLSDRDVRFLFIPFLIHTNRIGTQTSELRLGNT